MSENRFRPLALCVFHHNGKILVNRFIDPVTQEVFYRPLGGGIDFGERSSDAIVREIHEELGQSINDVRLLGTLESIFTYNGKPGHEFVRVYDAKFDDVDVYQQALVKGEESNGAPFTAMWCASSSFTPSSPLVPEGLYELLKSAELLE